MSCTTRSDKPRILVVGPVHFNRSFYVCDFSLTAETAPAHFVNGASAGLSNLNELREPDLLESSVSRCETTGTTSSNIPIDSFDDNTIVVESGAYFAVSWEQVQPAIEEFASLCGGALVELRLGEPLQKRTTAEMPCV